MKKLPDRLVDSAEANGVKWWWREDVLFSVACAEACLPVFEIAHPNDKRPRLAIEAARAWLANPTDDAICYAVTAGDAARDAANELDKSFTAASAAIAASNAAEATDTADWASDWAPIYAAKAGISEPQILSAFAREVAGTPLEIIVMAEQL